MKDLMGLLGWMVLLVVVGAVLVNAWVVFLGHLPSGLFYAVMFAPGFAALGGIIWLVVQASKKG